MKYIWLIFFVLNSNIINANNLTVTCSFEEVYKNGEIQNGFLLFTKNKLRYEYFDPKLFTIIFNKQWIVVDNEKKKTIPNVEQNLEVLKEINKYLQDFPNVPKKISVNDHEFIFEFSMNDQFLKTITIKSNKVNMKVHFYECESKLINNIYFSYDPVFKYNIQK